MNIIFIEAEKKATAEHYFLTAILAKYFPDVEYELIYMDGVGNLFNEANMNLMNSKKAEGSNCIAILDADTIAKGWGYIKRKSDIDKNQQQKGASFPYFLYPDNKSDGDVEHLMEKLAREDLHPTFFSCFHKYEMCVGSEIDESGKPRYNTPELKSKLHTYMYCQQLSNAQRKQLGRGNWLFDDLKYWDLGRDAVQPLVNFLRNNLK